VSWHAGGEEEEEKSKGELINIHVSRKPNVPLEV